MNLFQRLKSIRNRSGVWLKMLLPALVVVTVTFSGCRQQPHEEPEPRTGNGQNLVLILIDTLRQDRTSAYGYEVNTTPFLRRLASEGALLDGYSPTSWTRPATASLLTGLHPLRHQSITATDVLPSEVDTLPEILKRSGYNTIAVSANLHITKQWGFDQGFDVFLDMGELTKNPKSTAHDVNQFLENFLDRIEPPFFLYVHYIDPHAPYAPPTDGNGDPLGPLLEKYSPVQPEQLEGGAFARHRRSLEFVRAASDLYDGEIRFVDEHVANLMGSLETRGLMQETLTIVTADHGEEFEEHGRMSHGQSLFQEVVRVPFVVHGPGIARGARIEGRANLLDIVPTVVDLLEISPTGTSAAVSGVNIADSLRSGAPIPERSLFLHLDHIDGHTLGWISENWKLLVGTTPFAKDLFDLERDPTEQASLSTGTRLPSVFSDLDEDMVREYNKFQDSSMPRQVGSIDPEQRQQLAALGYVQGNDAEDTRKFPKNILEADDWPKGATGLEGEISHCIDLSSGLNQGQLYNGFYSVENISEEERGRWISGAASLSLSMAASSDRAQVVTFEGVNTRTRPYSFTAYAHDKAILGPVILSRPGTFHLKSSVLATYADSFLVSIDVSPPWEPAADNLEDDRSLGVFLSRICVEEVDLTTIGDEIDLAGDDHQVGLHTAFGLFPGEPSLSGRWTAPKSGFYISDQGGETSNTKVLTLNGINYREGTHPLTVRVDGRDVFSGTISLPGKAFTFNIPLVEHRDSTGIHYIEMETTPWSPGPSDDRILGTFLSHIGLHDIDPTTLIPSVDLTVDSFDETFLTGLRPEIDQDQVSGSWAEPHSSYLLSRPEPRPEHVYAVEMKGQNLRCDEHTITLLVNGVKVLTRSGEGIPCGATFSVEALVPSYLMTRDLALVELVVDSPPPYMSGGAAELGLGTVVDNVRLFLKRADTVLDRLYFFKPEAEVQMAYGFHLQEEGMDGRWIEPTGMGYILRVPDGAKSFYDLILNTVTFRGDSFTVTVFVNGDMVFEGRSGKQGAPLQAEVPIPDHLQPGDLAFVQVFVDPPFIPRDHGLADDRVLGTFVRRSWMQ